MADISAGKRGKGGGAKKYGKKARKSSVARYKSSNRLDENKSRRITRMMKRFPKYTLPAGWIISQVKAGKIVRDPRGRG